MDLSQIDDINHLKALAYDELVIQERSQANLRAITQRIAQVVSKPAEETPPDDTTDASKAA